MGVLNLRITGIVWVWHIDCGVYNGDVMLAIGVQPGQEISAGCVVVSYGIVVKVPVLIHVVDVGPVTHLVEPFDSLDQCYVPDGLQRNSKLGICVDNVLHLTPVRISPPTLMKAEGKVLLHSR